MKKLVLVALLAIFATNEYSNGQFLEPFQGPDEKWGFIDGTGKLIIPFKYDRVYGFAEGLAAVWLNGKGGFIDKTDNIVIPLKYGEMREFSEGLAMVTFNGRYGFIDKTDKVVIPFEYDNINGFDGLLYTLEPFYQGYAMVTIKGKNGFSDARYGFIDKTGTRVVPVKYTREKAVQKYIKHLKSDTKNNKIAVNALF